MVKWEAANRPNEFGGLGFMYVAMNICCEHWRNKYLNSKSIFEIKKRYVSQFWMSLLDLDEPP